MRAARGSPCLGLLPLQLSGTFFHPKFLGRARFLAGPRRRREAGRDDRDPRPSCRPRSPTPGSASCPAGLTPRFAAGALGPGRGGVVSEGGAVPPPHRPFREPDKRGTPPPSPPPSGLGLPGPSPAGGGGVGTQGDLGGRGQRRGGGGAPRRARAPPESGFPGGTSLVPGWCPEPARPPRLYGPRTHFRAVSTVRTRPGARQGLKPVGPGGSRISLPLHHYSKSRES